MNEEKNLNEENEELETEQTAEETAEETLEEAAEAAEEAEEAAAEAEETVEEAVEAEAEAEAAVEEAIETAETAEEASEAADEAIEVAEAAQNETEAALFMQNTDKKQLPIAKIAVAAVIVLVIAAIVVLAIIFAPRMFNKYNKLGYVDVSGQTIADVAENAGMSLEDFLDSYGLPADMPSNTTEAAAYYSIPCSRMAAMYGMDFETLKSTLELPDTVTEDTPWGEAEGETRLSVYVGEDNLADFKERYGFGDEITGDTQWKDVRNIVDEYSRQQRLDAEKAEKEAAEEETEETEAPAEEAAEAETAAE